jgi:hypothetical protein
MMNKRSPDFERIPRDKYQTPYKAVLPLIPYLRRDGVRTFAELCCGDGDLIRHVESFGPRCVHRGDIEAGQDALKVARYVGNPDVGITNPPYKYPDDPEHSTRLLRDLIGHFLDLGIPFWLLIYSDWMFNKNAALLLPKCSDIVAVGRVKWIPGTKHSGKDNCCWYRFAANHQGPTAFHNDRGRRAPVTLTAIAAE